MKLSQPINAKGDRILLPGEPGAVEAWVQARQREDRLQADERILGHLEKQVPGVLAMLGPSELRSLVALIRTLCAQTAKEHLRRSDQIRRMAEEYITALHDVPDPRDPGPGVVETAGPAG